MPTLRDAYNNYNYKYWKGKLPSDVQLKWFRGKDMGDFSSDYRGIIIRINSILKKWPVAWHATLLHEMAHLATASEKADHGPRWRKERRRLYELGAFETLL